MNQKTGEEFWPCDPALKQKAVEIYLRYKGTWGPETISLALQGRLSPRTIREAVKPYRNLWLEIRVPREKARESVPTLRTPDLVWAIDWTEYRLGGRKIFVLVIVDEASRFFLGWKILERVPGIEDVCSFIQDVMARRQGRPLLLKSDRAAVFLSAHWGALLMGQNILPHRVRPRSPWEQGIVERSIREVKGWLRANAPRTFGEFDSCLNDGMFMLNFLKPRCVLGGRTPAKAYLTGARKRVEEPACA